MRAIASTATTRTGMSNIAANVGRVLLGTLSLFVAWGIGGYLGSVICPNSVLVGGRETLAAKVGCSVAILAVSLILRRYLLRSFGQALVCLATTEVIVFVIIVCISGLTRLTLANVRFNIWWLYALTWNVVLAFLVGTMVGQLWDDRVSNKPGGVNPGLEQAANGVPHKR